MKRQAWQCGRLVWLVALAVGVMGCGTSSLRTGEMAQTFVAPLNDKEVVPLSRSAENAGEPIKKGENFVLTLRQVYLRYLSDPGFPNEVLVIVSIDDGSGVEKIRPIGLFEKVREEHKLNVRDEIIYAAKDFQGNHLKVDLEVYEVDSNPLGGKKFYRMTRALTAAMAKEDPFTNQSDPEAAAAISAATNVLRESHKGDIEMAYTETFRLAGEPRLREGTYVAVKQQYRPRALDSHTKFLAGALTLWYAPGDTPDKASWRPIDPSKLRVYNGELLRTLTEKEEKERDPNYHPSFWKRTKDFTAGLLKKEPVDYSVHDGYKEYRDKTHVVFTVRRIAGK